MKVLPTLYRNILFRSRLEARYAVFFDVLGETWEYEKEGYSLDDGDNYLPDFWLPRLDCFVEIKGRWPNAREVRVCRKLQYFTGKDILIYYGLPLENEGIYFSYDSRNGGRFTEEFVQWSLSNHRLIIRQIGGSLSTELEEAAIRAKSKRFEFGHQPEFAGSRARPSVADYNNISF